MPLTVCFYALHKDCYVVEVSSLEVDEMKNLFILHCDLWIPRKKDSMDEKGLVFFRDLHFPKNLFLDFLQSNLAWQFENNCFLVIVSYVHCHFLILFGRARGNPRIYRSHIAFNEYRSKKS